MSAKGAKAKPAATNNKAPAKSIAKKPAAAQNKTAAAKPMAKVAAQAANVAKKAADAATTKKPAAPKVKKAAAPVKPASADVKKVVAKKAAKVAAKPATKKAAKPAAKGAAKGVVKSAAKGAVKGATKAVSKKSSAAKKERLDLGLAPKKKIQKKVGAIGTYIQRGSKTKRHWIMVKKVENKKRPRSWTIDCTAPVTDGIMDVASFEKYLHDKFKPRRDKSAKAGVLGDLCKITRNKTSIQINMKTNLRKEYLKFITKKYLKKQQLRDWLRVVSKNKSSYELRYYQIQENDDEDEESDDDEA